MEIGDHIHWFLTDRCNLDCLYCFREYFKNDESKENLCSLAQILAENNVKRVTIGGGEPLMVKRLDDALKIIKSSGAYVSIHTNATLLNKKRIKELKNLVDEIAIPIDSVDNSIQKELKGIDYVPIFKKVVKNIQDENIKLGYHTVAISINVDKIPEIYDFIKNTDFLFWKIYEFVSHLPYYNIIHNLLKNNKKIDENQIYNRTEKLEGPFNYEKGMSDCLAAKFLLLAEKMEKIDSRIRFEGVIDEKPPYVFLDNSGNIGFYTWFSQKRAKIGNLFQDSFQEIKKKLKDIKMQGIDFDEQGFIESTVNIPIWQSIANGTYCYDDECEVIKLEYHEKVMHLAELYKKRKEKEHLRYAKAC